jgi:hypothetical protein
VIVDVSLQDLLVAIVMNLVLGLLELVFRILKRMVRWKGMSRLLRDQ